MTPALPIPSRLADASFSLAAGRQEEAEAIGRQLLGADPNNAGAWNLMGKLAGGDASAALEFFATAVSLAPSNLDYRYDLIEALRVSGDLARAQEEGAQALAVDPRGVVVMVALARTFEDAGDEKNALAQWERAVQLKPSLVPALLGYGGALQRAQRDKDALTPLKRGLRLGPATVEGWFYLGKAWAETGRPIEAGQAFEQATNLNPRESFVWFEWARSWAVRKDFNRAMACIDRAITLDEAQGRFHEERGHYCAVGKRWSEAIGCFKKAIQLGAGTAPMYSSMAQCFIAEHSNYEAMLAFLGAHRLEPENPNHLGNLAGIACAQGIITPALACLDEIIEKHPNYLPAVLNKSRLLREGGRASEGLVYAEKYLDLLSRNEGLKPKYFGGGDCDVEYSSYLYSLIFSSHYDAKEIFARHQNWGRRTEAGVVRRPRCPTRTSDRAGRIKIGYISPDLREHSIAAFIGTIFRRHDQSAFEIYVYSDVVQPDFVTKQLQSYGQNWREIAALRNNAVADLIAADNLDVLVELSGHTAGNRLPLFTLKPAPIQVAYLGYPATTGLTAIDYRLTDVWADPPGLADTLCTEKLLRLPDCAWCYSPSDARAHPVGPAPQLRNGYITFGCFNNIAKLNEPLRALWREILLQVPTARLRLKARAFADPEIKAEWLENFTQAGIAPEQLILMGHKANKADHLAEYNEVDIALDSFPYHGTTTTCEAIWAGVPVVTLAGDAHVSRVGVSLLTAVGLTDLIGASRADYIAQAVNLARDPTRLHALRAGLRAQLQHSVLGDEIGFTRKLEATYTQIVADYRAQIASPELNPVSPRTPVGSTPTHA